VGLFGALFFAIVIAVVVGGTIFRIWMLIDCATKEPSTGNDKVIWILVILLTHLIGASIYYFVRRPQRIQLYGV
jgi:nitrate reductase gamma subunit